MRRLAIVTLVLVGVAVSVQGQTHDLAVGETVLVAPEHAPSTPKYGTLAPTSVIVGATDLLPPHSFVGYATFNDDGIFRYETAEVNADWLYAVPLPNGAIIDSVQMYACDTSSTGQVVVVLRRSDPPGSDWEFVTPVVGTGLAETPGCASFSVTPTTSPLVVDNANHTYQINMAFGGDASSAVRVGSFRVIYRLQVSPAPAVATFSDVPTGHPFFRFVEALAAAGITGGCGGGQYCPDTAVTRGQMAVFLSIALGLHFPN
jgi:hypothetical protein